MKEVRLLVLSPSSPLSPGALYRHLVREGFRLRMKETCFGLVVEGEREEVERAVRKARELDPFGIFSKPRAYPPGDPRICRASRGGGPRMGFCFLDYEVEKLPLLSEALREPGEEREEEGRRRRLEVRELREILKEELA